ncbi:MAG: hypothetical protein OdinLCB4_001335 [Candidatus Odinarchaeum yellowstonii]|uniref:Uncharacterized protein n=1 Tax=Odinarchaeota yellowstonii (strain LCB_4) TaxID=1841599 RepID=A0AAF0D2R4_ODILC|nr:MAG: hypothetical protein OdinLCB4_001335 [Candidatus Odinarchaeum yellowstonii]
MVELSEKIFIQEILKAFHKFLKDYFENVKINFKIVKPLFKTYTLNFNSVRVDIKTGRLRVNEDNLYRIKLKTPAYYEIKINNSLFKRSKLPEIVRIGFENGLRTGNLLKILKFFAETCALTIILRLKANYGLAEEKYNLQIEKLLSKLVDSPFIRDQIKNLVNFLKAIGAPEFKDFTDIETVRTGLIQGLLLKNLESEIIGDVDSLKRILRQWFDILQESEAAESTGEAYYTIYDYRSIILENELIKAISRITGRVKPELEIKECLIHPSLIKVYKIVLKKDPPLKTSYIKVSSQLNELQLKKLLKELRYIKIQERKYNRLLMVKDLIEALTEDEEIKYHISQLYNFNRLKYDEIVNKTVEYALTTGIARSITI